MHSGTTKVSYHANADALRVVTGCVRANVAPTAALVHIAVLADEKIVADVPPAAIVHVEVLVGSHDRRTRLLVPAVRPGAAVMDDDVRRRRPWQELKVPALPGLPFLAADDFRALCESEIVIDYFSRIAPKLFSGCA